MKDKTSAPKPTIAASEALLNEVEAARFLNLSHRTLQSWRVRGGGPVFHSLGRAVRYRKSDLEVWLAGKARAHTSERVA